MLLIWNCPNIRGAVAHPTFQTAMKPKRSSRSCLGIRFEPQPDNSRMVARLDRKRLGQDTFTSKWSSIRGVFDKGNVWSS